MRNLNCKTWAVILLTAFFNVSQAQVLKGFVFGEGSPIPEVSILIASEKITETNLNGVFILPKNVQLPIEIRLEHPDFFIATFLMEVPNQKFKLQPLSNCENLEEVILSSTYQKESNIILPTRIISEEKFNTYSPIDLVSAVNETPGVFIQSGAINTNRITIRGVGSRTLYGTNKIRAYFNGIPITDGAGETTIDLFNPENLQTLEIVKGPKATQYGTNLGGTLLLNSKELASGESKFHNNFTIGSFGLIKNSISLATSSEKFSINMNYDHLQTEGFRQNSKYNRKGLLISSKYRFNGKNELGLLLNYIDYFAQIPSSIGITAFNEDPAQAAFTWAQAQGFENNKKTLAGLRFTHRFSEKFSNTSTVFYSYLDHYEPRPFNILDEFTNGYGGRTVFAKDFLFLGNSGNLSFGGEFYKDEYNWKTIENLYENNNGNGSLEGDLLSDNKEIRKNLNVFGTVSLSFSKKLKGEFGLNFNKTNYNFVDQFNIGATNKNASRSFDPILAPNVNLLYQFNNKVNAYANVSRGFNYPSIEETLTPAGVINPELGPEIGYNYEIGSQLFLQKRKIEIQANAYFLDIENLLVAERVGDDQFIGRNAGRTEHKGVEMSIKYREKIGKNILFSPYMNFEFTDHNFVDFVDNENDFSGNNLTGVPDKKLNGGIQLKFKNLLLNTNFLHIGKIPLNDANDLYSEKYTVLNAKASFNCTISENIFFELNTGVSNFLDTKYAASVLINATGFGNSDPRYYYPGLPINWFGGFKISYLL
ncbi:TonB-dependent receptor family protein [Aequorivita echinoideorum]|uniref:TonB-dependent receptor n=1 Tax=Aequorivita echinoideorum TaxID=1549647 RepID=A0ABS5S7R9_9FLAO|nr:TonB-dependent receptor [Aequorivita echinoideorum]MBT0607915.1 TonB-dependent receptor [Aequorivita echinoideorum]